MLTCTNFPTKGDVASLGGGVDPRIKPGDDVCIMYFYFAPEIPLWGGIFWSAPFTIVSVVMIWLCPRQRNAGEEGTQSPRDWGGGEQGRSNPASQDRPLLPFHGKRLCAIHLREQIPSYPVDRHEKIYCFRSFCCVIHLLCSHFWSNPSDFRKDQCGRVFRFHAGRCSQRSCGCPPLASNCCSVYGPGRLLAAVPSPP